MRTLPRVLAVTSDAVCRAPSFAEQCRALGALGESFGILVRAPGSTAAEHATFVRAAAQRLGGSALFVHARPDLAAAIEADGLQLRRGDLAPLDARKVFAHGPIGVSVHDRGEAEAAIGEGADYLLAGSLYQSTSHPGRRGQGLPWLESLVRLGRPVIAIGGITPARAVEVRNAGAWGVGVISAIWGGADPAAAARELLAGWDGEAGEIRLTVNGESKRVRRPVTLAGLLAELELDPRTVVVELNRRIVRRTELAAIPLGEGDAVELVHFVGGG